MRCDNVNPLDVHEINRRSVSNSNSEETVVSIGPIYMKKKPKPEEIQSFILENDQQVNVKRGIFTGLLTKPKNLLFNSRVMIDRVFSFCTEYGVYPIIKQKLCERDLSCEWICMKTLL